jgi:hypothetical protein
MRRLFPIPRDHRRVLSVVAVAVLAAAVGALAFFAAQGSGTASGSVGTLGASSISGATPGQETAAHLDSGRTSDRPRCSQLLRPPRRGRAQRKLPERVVPVVGDQLHRHRGLAGQPHLHRHRGMALVEHNEQLCERRRPIEPDSQLNEPQLARPGR